MSQGHIENVNNVDETNRSPGVMREQLVNKRKIRMHQMKSMDTSVDTTKAGRHVKVVNLSSVKEGTLDHLVA